MTIPYQQVTMENKGFIGTIRRMWNIVKMWFLVRKLYQLLISQALEAGLRSSGDRGLKRAMKIGNLSIPRWLLAGEFMRHWEKIPDQAIALNYERHIYKNQQLISAAIDKEFIREEQPHILITGDESASIYLTGKGSDFRTPTYLVKYLIEELGVVWSIIITVLTTLGFSSQIIKLIQKIV